MAQRNDRGKVLFELDEPMEEMLEYIYGQRPATALEAKQLLKGARITVEFVNYLCLYAYATLFAHARRGDVQAAMELIHRAQGPPDRPFAEEVQRLDAVSAAKLMYQVLRESGQSPEEARQQVLMLSAPALEQTGQKLRQEDLQD